jgi:hypothetical protein
VYVHDDRQTCATDNLRAILYNNINEREACVRYGGRRWTENYLKNIFPDFIPYLYFRQYYNYNSLIIYYKSMVLNYINFAVLA